MDKVKISIVVPVYNAEKYLRECVDSILNQTFTDFKINLVNDGSTDKSGEICRELQKKHSENTTQNYPVMSLHKEKPAWKLVS